MVYNFGIHRFWSLVQNFQATAGQTSENEFESVCLCAAPRAAAPTRASTWHPVRLSVRVPHAGLRTRGCASRGRAQPERLEHAPSPRVVRSARPWQTLTVPPTDRAARAPTTVTPLLPFLLCMQRRPARPHTAYKSCRLRPHTCTPGRRLPEPCRPSIGALREARPLDPKHGHSTILVHPLDPTGAHVVVCCWRHLGP
jgi:hypothetical protein